MGTLNLRILEFHSPGSLRAEMEKIGASSPGMKIMLPKGIAWAVKLEGVGFAAANILKQEMLSLGGEAVLPKNIYFGRIETCDVLLLGTQRDYEGLIKKLRVQPLKSLLALASEIRQALARYGNKPEPTTIGNKTFNWGERTFIMGILNMTPDSFSGDGIANDLEGALSKGVAFAQSGADIIDVGGESTRPGSVPISAEEEIARVLPLIEKLTKEVDLPISIDTYKSEVAEQALRAGAAMINDVWGLHMNPALANLAAKRKAPLILMHNRSRPKDAAQAERLGGRYVGVEYQELMADVIRELRDSIDLALEAKVPKEKIIVDPGIGFGKTVQQNLEILRELAQFKVLGHPVLVGPSRKSFIGYTLDLPPEDRLEGTAAAVALAIAQGVDIVRVHDVKEMARVAKMADAIVRGKLEIQEDNPG